MKHKRTLVGGAGGQGRGGAGREGQESLLGSQGPVVPVSLPALHSRRVSVTMETGLQSRKGY